MKWSTTFFLLSFLQLSIAQSHRSIDGSSNNFNHPLWGAFNQPLFWETPNGYADGVSEPGGIGLPNPRRISHLVFSQRQQSLADEAGRSAYVWLFGQFIKNEIAFVPTLKNEPFPITFSEEDYHGDPLLQNKTIPFFRAAFAEESGTDPQNPRSPLNAVTSWIDGSAVYGSNAQHAKWLRTFRGGKLKTSDLNLLPFNTKSGEYADTLDVLAPKMITNNDLTTRLFVAGNRNVNTHLGLIGLQTVFVREHNRLCDEYARKHPNWCDEEIYQHVRQYLGALIQQIAFYEWLPALGIRLEEYNGYNPELNPAAGNVFISAAMHFLSSMTNDQFVRMDNFGNNFPEGNLTFRDASYAPVYFPVRGSISPILKGLATQVSEKSDIRMVDDLRNMVYGDLDQYLFDAAAAAIQMGRERGLPDFNTVRKSFGLPAYEHFEQITDDIQLSKILRDLYRDCDNLDAIVGMLAEKKEFGSAFGQTLSVILKNQFTKLRDGDRYYFENDLHFSAEELLDIRLTKLSDLIKRNTDIFILQEDIFFAVPHEKLGAMGAIKNHLDLIVYPNPVPDHFHFALKSEETGSATLRLTDLSGKIIQNEEIWVRKGLVEREYYFPQNTPDGIYFLSILQNGKMGEVKLLHQ